MKLKIFPESMNPKLTCYDIAKFKSLKDICLNNTEHSNFPSNSEDGEKKKTTNSIPGCCKEKSQEDVYISPRTELALELGDGDDTHDNMSEEKQNGQEQAANGLLQKQNIPMNATVAPDEENDRNKNIKEIRSEIIHNSGDGLPENTALAVLAAQNKRINSAVCDDAVFLDVIPDLESTYLHEITALTDVKGISPEPDGGDFELVSLPQYTGTIKPVEGYDDEEDCALLYQVIASQDWHQLIRILVSRPYIQRQNLEQMFQLKYSKYLTNLLRSQLQPLSGDLVAMLLLYPEEVYAQILRDGLKKIDDYPLQVVEILGSQSSQVIKDIGDTYQGMFGSILSSDLIDDNDSSLHRLLGSLAMGKRYEGNKVNVKEVFRVANELMKGPFDLDNEEFFKLLTKQSLQQIRMTLKEYEQGMFVALGKNSQTPDLEALTILVNLLRDPVQYFAEEIRTLLQDGTRISLKRLAFLLVSRSEIDLEDIKQRFFAEQGRALDDTIALCSFEEDLFKEFLLAIVRGTAGELGI
ncbi:hypothetical protein CAPTEDRAFT_214124 [Capitella teleta]|uniref:Annexin n=1 Tax=Capitella teleta TaxID=283909 RepID=R7TKV5_CAPTE|nr:hypothetical protein CAPTEDRAFT_214124 [Capitella teleta]|eukprot:ELT94147.1 hypothetical protein CAPTEDRAFT_214124 [Capitella teleta]